MVLWYRGDLAKHITTVQQGKTHIWLKISQTIGTCDKNIYLCAAYTPPSESPYFNEEFFNTLHTEIVHFQAQGNVMVCGDLNARTGIENDSIDPKGIKHVFGQAPLHLSPTQMWRNNPDKLINKNGRELVHLWRALGLYILNGRIVGDSLGRFTYSSTLGSSVVDYAITDMDLSSISAFTVRQQTPLSDHNQMNVFLKKICKYEKKLKNSPVSCIILINHTDGLQTVKINISKQSVQMS